MLCPDTSSNSLLHRLARRGGRSSKPPRQVSIYLLVVTITYIPLLVAARFGSVPLWNGSAAGQLTFLHDWGLNFALLISLPSLVVLLVSDEYVLSTSLDEVQQDGVLVLSESAAKSLKKTWNQRFRIWNLIAQLAAITIGIVLAVITVQMYIKQEVASWVAPEGQLHLAGYVYLYCIILLYAVIIFYVTRCIIISLFLRALVNLEPLHILPLHPDKCGGLRPVGRLGLRNQYTLTILGINIVLLLAIWVFLMHRTTSYGNVMIAGSAVYLILGPVIFMAPLLPFRAGMQNAKKKWTHEFARVLGIEFERLREQIRTNQVTDTDEKSIERLRKVSAAIDELPIWPFDQGTLRKFATAYILPAALPLLGQGVLALLKAIRATGMLR